MLQNPLRLYAFKRLSDVPWLPILEINFGRQEKSTLFQDINPELYRGIWDLVDNIADADYCIFPHNHSSLKKYPQYVSDCLGLAGKHKKTTILFAYQDSHESIDLLQTIVFRSSQYLSYKKPNEIIMPAFVEDLSLIHPIYPKEKSQKPAIGFVGKAGFESFTHLIRYTVKNFLRSHPYKDGLYYRRKVMKILSSDKRIKTNFIVRSSYSGNTKSIPLDPSVARTEYVGNMANSDMVLTVKGDGNYSLRFYEVLSSGRIPLFLDTECILPLEEIISYKDFVVRVSYKEMKKISDIAYHTYMSWSAGEYKKKQAIARETFEKFLFMPEFLKITFTKDFLNKYSSHNK